MRTIERNIVGVFIMSADGKILLGYNREGGVNQGELVVPGGGVEEGEALEVAAKREMLEEVGINLADISLIPLEKPGYGESPKTLPTGEVVLMKMTFHNFTAILPSNAADIQLRFDDDFAIARWFTPQELSGQRLGDATKKAIQFIWPEHTF